MPWNIILSPFWIMPMVGWIILATVGSIDRDLIMVTGAANMTVSPIMSIALFMAFYPAYREAKRRAKRDAKIDREIESEKIEPAPTASE